MPAYATTSSVNFKTFGHEQGKTDDLRIMLVLRFSDIFREPEHVSHRGLVVLQGSLIIAQKDRIRHGDGLHGSVDVDLDAPGRKTLENGDEVLFRPLSALWIARLALAKPIGLGRLAVPDIVVTVGG